MAKASAIHPAHNPAPEPTDEVETSNIFQGESATVADVGEGVYMTFAQGQNLVNAGFATADVENTEGEAAFVTLTDKGRAELANPGQAPKPSGEKPTFTLRNDIPVPTTRRRGPNKTGSQYPFDQMEIGQSFHIPKTDEDKDPAQKIASSVAMARKRFAEKVTNEDGTPKMVTKTIKEWKRNEDDSYAKGEDGKRIQIGSRTETIQAERNTRDWMVATVSVDDPQGPGARVWRIAMKEGDNENTEDEDEGDNEGDENTED